MSSGLVGKIHVEFLPHNGEEGAEGCNGQPDCRCYRNQAGLAVETAEEEYALKIECESVRGFRKVIAAFEGRFVPTPSGKDPLIYSYPSHREDHNCCETKHHFYFQILACDLRANLEVLRELLQALRPLL